MTGPLVNRRFILASRPQGSFSASDLSFGEEPVPELKEGEALIRNLYLSIDPSNRIWMNEGASYMPPIALGEAMRGATIGRVTASRTRRFPEGALLLGLGGWQDYRLIAANDPSPFLRIRQIPGVPLPAMLGVLAAIMHGAPASAG
jgi:hypothetical protein